MARPNLMNDVKACLELERPEQLPVFISANTPLELKLLGITHDEYATDADKIVAVHSWGIETFDSDYIFVHVDSCVVLEPIGIEGGPKGAGLTEPWTPRTHLPSTKETLESLVIPSPETDGRMPIVLDAIRRLKEKFVNTVCIAGHVTGPFSTATYIFNTTEIMMALYVAPEWTQEAIDFAMRLQLRFAESQLAAGADAIWIGDLNSASNLISMEHYRRFAYQPTQALIEGITATGGISFYHQNEPDAGRIKETAGLIPRGAGAINVGQGGNIFEVYQELQGRACILGGLDPWDILRKTPDALDRQVKDIIDGVSSRGGHILNTGGQTAVETPIVNIATIIQAARKYWR